VKVFPKFGKASIPKYPPPGARPATYDSSEGALAVATLENKVAMATATTPINSRFRDRVGSEFLRVIVGFCHLVVGVRIDRC